jgi:hypothetical protein
VVSAGTELADGDVLKIQKAGIKTIRVKPVAPTSSSICPRTGRAGLIAQANTPPKPWARVPDQVVVRVEGDTGLPGRSFEQVA